MYTEQTSDGQIISLLVKCPVTKKTFAVKYNEFDFEEYSGPCDLCGDHGEVTYTYDCKFCKTSHKKPRVVQHKIYIKNY